MIRSFLPLLLLSACVIDVPAEAPELPNRDAGREPSPADSGFGEPDAGEPLDAGLPYDSGSLDAHNPWPVDAGHPEPVDGGGPWIVDAGWPEPIDGGPWIDDAGQPVPIDGGGGPGIPCAHPFDCPPGFYCSAEGLCLETPQPNDAGAPPPEDERGTSIQTAAASPLNAPIDAAIHFAGDEDFFRFTVLQAGNYRIYTTGQTDTFCHLLTPQGRQLAQNDDGGERFNCLIELQLQPGVYIVKVRHWSQRQTGTYTLHFDGPNAQPAGRCGDGRVDAGEQCDDGNRLGGDGCDANCRLEGPIPGQDDHSNTGAGATALPVHGRVDGTINWPGDVDYFVVTAAQDGEIILGTIGITDTRCRAESVMGAELASDSDSGAGGNCQIRFAVQAGRPIYLRVEGQNQAIVGAYTTYATTP